MRSLLLVVLLAEPAFPQTLPFDFHKAEGGKVDASALQEDLDFLSNQAQQNKAFAANLTVNGVVTTVSASNPICSTGGANPNITFCGNIAESQVTNLVSDLASKLPINGGTITGTLVVTSTLTVGGYSGIPHADTYANLKAAAVTGTPWFAYAIDIKEFVFYTGVITLGDKGWFIQ